MKHPKGESHRIYWQQWLSSSATAGHVRQGRRELITSSAAIRISPDTARARDVTTLLRNTLNLSSLDSSNNNGNGKNNPNKNNKKEEENGNNKNDQEDPFHDALVLVGTLYSLPRDYVQFEHEAPPPPPPAQSTLSVSGVKQQNGQPAASSSNNATGSSTVVAGDGMATTSSSNKKPSPPAAYYTSANAAEPFHVVKTLKPNDNPLQLRDIMLEHLKRIQEHAVSIVTTSTLNATNATNGSSGANTSTMLRGTTCASSIAPKIQWYFVPGRAEPTSPIPTCIDLDGYCTSMEEEEDDDDDYEDDDTIIEEESEDEYNLRKVVDADEHDLAHDIKLFLDSTCSDYDLLVSRCPLLSLSNKDIPSTAATTTTGTSQITSTTTPSRLTPIERKQKRRQRRELRRYSQLSQCRPWNLQCVSGYLLKQSHRDPHVWRRVHCVLTEDYLWYVTRVENHPPLQQHHYPLLSQQQQQQQQHAHHAAAAAAAAVGTPHFRMARHHGRIDLVRALLLEPNSTEYSPLYRTPYSFEVVSAKGTSHVFRASNRTLQMRWIQALSERILQRQENSLMAHAELIVADECIARNKRMTAVAVQPLWTAYDNLHLVQSTTSSWPRTSFSSSNPLQLPQDGIVSDGGGNNMMNVLRFGMEVAEYRERCRHVQAILPAKQPIVVMSDSPIRRAGNSSSSLLSTSSPDHLNHNGKDLSKGGKREPLDTETKAMVRATWHAAVTLLSRATQVAMDVQREMTTTAAATTASTPGSIATSKEGKRMSRSLETLCRHVDYIITGQFRQLSDSGTGFRNNNNSVATSTTSENGGTSSSHDDPPPMDLFDLLLAELQSVSATTDYRHRSTHHNEVTTTTKKPSPLTPPPKPWSRHTTV